MIKGQMASDKPFYNLNCFEILVPTGEFLYIMASSYEIIRGDLLIFSNVENKRQLVATYKRGQWNDIKLMDTSDKKCTRCGACCVVSKCKESIDGNMGICKYLIYNQDRTTSCELLMRGNIKPQEIFIGLGCVMKFDPKQYQRALQETQVKLNIRGGVR